MARARNIKPSLFENELLGAADPLLTILFASLWCLADKAGRLEDRPLRIKAKTFPYRDGVDCNGLLTELSRLGFIQRYEVDGMALIQVITFKKHQAPHHTEKDSELPPPPKEGGVNAGDKAKPPLTPLNNGEVPVALPLIPDSGFIDSLIPDPLIPDPPIQGKTPVEQKPLDVFAEQISTIFAYWQKVMKSPHSVLDKDRTKIIKTALKNYSPADICKAIRGCSKTPYNMGKNEQKTKYNHLGLILRSAEYIDRFIALDADPARAAVETMDETNARATAAFLGNDAVNDDMTIEMEA